MENQTLPSVSIIVRALNEEKFLPESLLQIKKQNYRGAVEIVVVDSGSTDDTVKIADRFKSKIIHIPKSEFTFGRSLNFGCEAGNGEILVFLSAHCIPCDENWLNNLIKPLIDGISSYAYGRQIPRLNISKFSEGMVFNKYFPQHSTIPQIGYFCNNANSAIQRRTWKEFRFNEALTGLEDMELAKRLVNSGGSVSYVASSSVEHIHEEPWKRIKIRYEREAAALVKIEPNLNLSFGKAVWLFLLSLKIDIKALNNATLRSIKDVILYRACQYYGSYIGSSASKLYIHEMQTEYFYPTTTVKVARLTDITGRSQITPSEPK